jgi:hypothetical protein
MKPAEYVPGRNETIFDTCKEVVRMARQCNQIVKFEFEGIRMTCYPDTTVDFLVGYYIFSSQTKDDQGLRVRNLKIKIQEQIREFCDLSHCEIARVLESVKAELRSVLP